MFHLKDCTEVSFCNGRTALCPPADTKSDNVTECNGGTQVPFQLFMTGMSSYFNVTSLQCECNGGALSTIFWHACQPSIHKDLKCLKWEIGQVCQQGDCKGSICLKYGMEQCFLSSKDKNVRYNTRDLCELACQVSGKLEIKYREGRKYVGQPLFTHIDGKHTGRKFRSLRCSRIWNCSHILFRSLAGTEAVVAPLIGQRVER